MNAVSDDPDRAQRAIGMLGEYEISTIRAATREEPRLVPGFLYACRTGLVFIADDDYLRPGPGVLDSRTFGVRLAHLTRMPDYDLPRFGKARLLIHEYREFVTSDKAAKGFLPLLAAFCSVTAPATSEHVAPIKLP